MKLFSKITESIMSEHVNAAEENQGCRKNRSTIVVIFIVRHVVEKAVEYNN